MTITRKDYLDGKVSHHEYYLAVAKTCGVSYELADPVFLARVKKALDDGDIHLNSIPLQVWDRRGAGIVGLQKAFREHGGYDSLAGRVCLLKAVAKEAVK